LEMVADPRGFETAPLRGDREIEQFRGAELLGRDLVSEAYRVRHPAILVEPATWTSAARWRLAEVFAPEVVGAVEDRGAVRKSRHHHDRHPRMVEALADERDEAR